MVKYMPKSHHHTHEQVNQVMSEIFGIEDMTTFDLARGFGHIHHLLVQAAESRRREGTLTDARLGMLTWLLVSERIGVPEKVTPSMLSEFRKVSRNTVSALLRSMEDQGLIERALDPEDRRRFHIQLTDAGRQLVLEHAPVFAAETQYVFNVLTPQEQKTLLRLLDKLRIRLQEIVHEDYPEH
jgi:DNA-binding MarR family transcriptional regulator